MHRGLADMIAEREADIVDQMVLNWRGGKASYEYLHSMVACISELRRFEHQLDQQARLSIEQANKGFPS